jgi:hypothetical protein
LSWIALIGAIHFFVPDYYFYSSCKTNKPSHKGGLLYQFPRLLLFINHICQSSKSEITIYQTVQHKKYLGLSSPIGTNMAMTVSLPWNKAPTKIPSKSAIKI